MIDITIRYLLSYTGPNEKTCCCFSDCIADNVTNAQVLSVRDVLYDHTVEYDCEPGYLHEGGDLVRTCQDNGVLSGEPPICIGKYR